MGTTLYDCCGKREGWPHATDCPERSRYPNSNQRTPMPSDRAREYAEEHETADADSILVSWCDWQPALAVAARNLVGPLLAALAQRDKGIAELLWRRQRVLPL